MSSPIFDATFRTGRFRHEEPMTTSGKPSPEPQGVREALELQLFDLVELARDSRSDKGGAVRWVHPRGDLVKEFAKRIAALAQSDAEPAVDAGLIEAAEWLSTAASRFEEAADALQSEYKTYARQMDRWAGDTRERARLFRILSRAADRPDVSGLIEAAEWHDKQVADCNKYLKQSPADHILLSIRGEHKASAGYFRSRAADRSVHGELIPDCPTEGVAARQGNGG